MVDVQLFGVHAGAHHLVNVFLHAKAARFADAVRTAEEARALALEEGNQKTANANAKLLECYRAGKPFHEGAN